MSGCLSVCVSFLLAVHLSQIGHPTIAILILFDIFHNTFGEKNKPYNNALIIFSWMLQLYSIRMKLSPLMLYTTCEGVSYVDAVPPFSFFQAQKQTHSCCVDLWTDVLWEKRGVSFLGEPLFLSFSKLLPWFRKKTAKQAYSPQIE